MSKSILRKKLIRKRQIKNKNSISISTKKFYNLIKNYDLNNITVGGYYPVNYEVDDLDLLKDLTVLHKSSSEKYKKKFSSNNKPFFLKSSVLNNIHAPNALSIQVSPSKLSILSF